MIVLKQKINRKVDKKKLEEKILHVILYSQSVCINLLVQWIERNYIKVVTDDETYGQMINSPSVACISKKEEFHKSQF